MAAYVRHPLTLVWAFLTVTTIVSWLISQDGGAPHQLNLAVTIGVLMIAAVKARLVILFFMEARHAPVWLKRTLDGWLAALIVLLLATYAAYL